MAEAVRYFCEHCHHSIESWSDGNPYYIDRNGAKQYVYHPDSRVAQCIGNESPHLCLCCGSEFTVDSLAPIAACPKCSSSEFVSTFRLTGQQCPYCKKGTFILDQEFRLIS